MYTFVKPGAFRGSLISSQRLTLLCRHLENHNKQGTRGQHEAVVGSKLERDKNDEFSIIERKTKERLEKPKKNRPPFLKNLFIKKIDPTILEFPELWQEDLDELNRQIDPVIAKVRADVNPRKIDQNGVIPNDSLSDLANFGAFVHQIARTYNGNDLSNVGYSRMIEALSENGNISLGTLGYVQGNWATQLISKHGSEEQKNYFLPQIADGSKFFSFCASEEESGNHVVNMNCSVRLGPDNRGYLLNGKKSWVVNAPKSDYFVVIAKHDGVGMNISADDPVKSAMLENEKVGSMSAFIVPRKAPGVTIGELVPFIGLKGLQISEVIFQNVALPLDTMLGMTGDGFRLTMEAATGERHVFACIVLPLLKKILADATKHAIHRRIFNRSLYEFDLIKDKLAETAYFTYALESMTYLTALLVDQTVNPEFDIESATVRVFAGDIVPRCILNIMQVYGAAGVRMDNELELNLRDILTLFQLDGGTDISRLYITLSAIKYAGVTYTEEIQKTVNPFNFPQLSGKSVAQFFGRAPKRQAFLEDFVHPTLTVAAVALEESCMQLFEVVEELLFNHHKQLIDRQMDLRRLSEIMTVIYGGFACLGRASRSYCIGIKNSKHEVDLALMFIQHMVKRVRELCRDIEDEGNGRDVMIHSAMDQISKNKGYCCDHALARNY